MRRKEVNPIKIENAQPVTITLPFSDTHFHFEGRLIFQAEIPNYKGATADVQVFYCGGSSGCYAIIIEPKVPYVLMTAHFVDTPAQIRQRHPELWNLGNDMDPWQNFSDSLVDDTLQELKKAVSMIHVLRGMPNQKKEIADGSN